MNTTKISILSSPILKKPSSSNVKYIPIKYLKEVLTLKTTAFIKFNQIQIKKIETEIFNTPTLKTRNIAQKEISEVNNIELNTLFLLPNEIKITFSTPEPLPQTTFTATKHLPQVAAEPLPQAPIADSLLIKRKRLGLSKHKINTIAFAFNKPSNTNSLEFNGIDKPKEVIKKNKPLNKNTEILDFLFKIKDNNNNNNNTNISTNKTINKEDIFDIKNMEYVTPPIRLLEIITVDSQTKIQSSVSPIHSPYITSLSSPTIYSSIIDSNATTQAFNIFETFELVSTSPMSPILSKNNSTPNTNVISTSIQKNQ
jgi:hypothetical protein